MSAAVQLAPLPYTGQQLVDVLLGEVGYREGAGNANKYGHALGMPHVPWCALLVEWASRQAGGSLVDHLGIPWRERGWTPSYAAAGRRLGRLVSPAVAEPGDLVLFDWPDRTRRVQHIAVVTGRASSSQLRTVEGNTSSDDAGSQDNGDGVYQRTRSTRYVVCVVRPLYAAQSGAPASPVPAPRPEPARPAPTRTGGLVVQLVDLRRVRGGHPSTYVRGPLVPPMQRLIGTPADGIAGPATVQALSHAQARCRVARDLVFGPATASALLAGK